jgi:outer membrane protein assembly factor BamB
MKAQRLLLVAVGVGMFAAAAGAADWPQWRGPNRDNRVVGFTAPATWPKELTQKWKVPVGLGDASPALVGDRLYLFTRQGGDEVILCLDGTTGKEVWKDAYPAITVMGGARDHPGPRSSPAVASGKVCALGVGGVLSCLDAATGKVAWRKETNAWPRFYTAASPILVDGRCIVGLGGQGKGSIAAFDLTSGEEAWKWENEGPAYGSPILATFDGKKQIVTLTERSLVGVDVADGKLLWQVPFSSGRYNNGTPVVDGPVVFCAGRAIKIEKSGDEFAATELWKSMEAPHMYNTPVLKDGLLYGMNGRRSFFCVDAKNGETLWTDATARGECGTVLDAGTVLLALTSDTDLLVFRPGKTEFSEIAKYKVADTAPWAYPIIDGNRIYVKDRETLTLWTIP